MVIKFKEENCKNMFSKVKFMKNKFEEVNEKKVIKISGLIDIRFCIV